MMDAPRLAADELRVLGLAARGLSSRDIADLIGWPVQRVRAAQCGAIMALGAASKLEAVIIAIRAGLIHPTVHSMSGGPRLEPTVPCDDF